MSAKTIEMDAAESSVPSHHPSSGNIARAMRIGQRVARLPALQVPNWCDLAANCVALDMGGVAVAVFIGVRVPSDPNQLIIHDIGVSDGTAWQPPDQEHPASSPLSAALRCRAHEVRYVPLVAVASSGEVKVAPSATHHEDLVERLFAAPTRGTTIRAHCAIPGTRRTVLLVVDQPPGSGESPSGGDPNGTLAEAAVHGIASRAALALGDHATDRRKVLTPLECRALELIVTGLKMPQVALRMGRSNYTVSDYSKSIHRKLGVSSTGELIARFLGHAVPSKA